jgi:transcriptional/translational regulatory protein YebC/TACO1
VYNCKAALEKKGFTVKAVEVVDYPNTTVELSDEKMAEFQELLKEINEIADVSDISHNVEPPEGYEEEEEES